jgi:hypothetical protein
MAVTTLQSNIKNYSENDFITNYSLFMGVVDTTNPALKVYDPLKNGRGRIFFLRMPEFLNIIMEKETKRVRHMLEYGFTKIDGIGDLTLETESMTGGHAGKQITMPTLAKDDTNSINIGLYEFAGSPVREYIDMWITGISDKETGYSTYHGLCDPNIVKERYGADTPVLPYSQRNHTAEAIYLTTDPTGLSSGIEYCCLLTNMFPTQSNRSHFNYSAGESSMVQIDIPFSCNKYESAQINQLGKWLLERQSVLKSSLDFQTQYTQADISAKYKPYINAWAGSADVDQSDATDLQS